jgi:hypothetical protein
MGLRDLSLGELWACWTIDWSFILGLLFIDGTRDITDLLQDLAIAAGASAMIGAWFALPSWIIIKVL